MVRLLERLDLDFPPNPIKPNPNKPFFSPGAVVVEGGGAGGGVEAGGGVLEAGGLVEDPKKSNKPPPLILRFDDFFTDLRFAMVSFVVYYNDDKIN